MYCTINVTVPLPPDSSHEAIEAATAALDAALEGVEAEDGAPDDAEIEEVGDGDLHAVWTGELAGNELVALRRFAAVYDRHGDQTRACCLIVEDRDDAREGYEQVWWHGPEPVVRTAVIAALDAEVALLLARVEGLRAGGPIVDRLPVD